MPFETMEYFSGKGEKQNSLSHPMMTPMRGEMDAAQSVTLQKDVADKYLIIRQILNSSAQFFVRRNQHFADYQVFTRHAFLQINRFSSNLTKQAFPDEKTRMR